MYTVQVQRSFEVEHLEILRTKGNLAPPYVAFTMANPALEGYEDFHHTADRSFKGSLQRLSFSTAASSNMELIVDFTCFYMEVSKKWEGCSMKFHVAEITPGLGQH